MPVVDELDLDVVVHDDPTETGARIEVHSVSGKPLEVSLADGELRVGYSFTLVGWEGFVEKFRTFRDKESADVHIAVPRTARQQAAVGAAVPADTAELLPGDLLTFGWGKRISHIGIYVGNGRFIHASTKARRVIETNLLRPRAAGIKPWRGARRLVLSDSVPQSAPADSAS